MSVRSREGGVPGPSSSSFSRGVLGVAVQGPVDEIHLPGRLVGADIGVLAQGPGGGNFHLRPLVLGTGELVHPDHVRVNPLCGLPAVLTLAAGPGLGLRALHTRAWARIRARACSRPRGPAMTQAWGSSTGPASCRFNDSLPFSPSSRTSSRPFPPFRPVRRDFPHFNTIVSCLL